MACFPVLTQRMRSKVEAKAFASELLCWAGEGGLRLGGFLPIPEFHEQETRFSFQTAGVA